MASWKFSGPWGCEGESNPNAVAHEAIRTTPLLHPHPSCPCSPPPATLDIQSGFVSLAQRRRDWKAKIVVGLLCQVLSPYSAFLELFSQRRWLLPLPWLSFHLHDALGDHLIFVRRPHCLPVSLRGVQKRLGKGPGIVAPELSVECRTHLPQVKAISYGLKSMLETLP